MACGGMALTLLVGPVPDAASSSELEDSPAASSSASPSLSTAQLSGGIQSVVSGHREPIVAGTGGRGRSRSGCGGMVRLSLSLSLSLKRGRIPLRFAAAVVGRNGFEKSAEVMGE